MIPKIIHYCWFGGKSKPEEFNKYLESWKRYCPNYEIKEWNESNFDLNANDYCREAYEAKKWAFVADYARLKVLEKYGGIYMDTDVELIRSLDKLLHYNAFMCFEEKNSISIGTLGSEKNSPVIKDFLSEYTNRHFKKNDGTFNMITNLKIITPILVQKYGLTLNGEKQVLNPNILILPMESFIAKDFLTGWIVADDTTYAIHHYEASWYSEEERKYMLLHRYYSRIYLKKSELIIGKMASLKVCYKLYGLEGVVKKILRRVNKQHT